MGNMDISSASSAVNPSNTNPLLVSQSLQYYSQTVNGVCMLNMSGFGCAGGNGLHSDSM